jgi:hypothetical protein
MSYIKSFTAIFLLITLFSAFSYAQEKDMMKDNMNKKEMMDKEMMMKFDKNMDGLAINGYDPVSYFTEGEPETGMPGNGYEWMGAKWQFTSEEHLNMFKENPTKYAPQFGGYCAYALSLNKLVPADPAFWTIDNGMLYLNANGDAEKLFRKDAMSNIKTAEKNWKSLSMDDDNMMEDKMEMKK